MRSGRSASTVRVRRESSRDSSGLPCASVRATSCAMPSTHVSLHYHLVFSTKNREPWIHPTHRDRIHDYIGGTIRGLGGVPHRVGGVADHVHVFAGLRATHCLADVVSEVKS